MNIPLLIFVLLLLLGGGGVLLYFFVIKEEEGSGNGEVEETEETEEGGEVKEVKEDDESLLKTAMADSTADIDIKEEEKTLVMTETKTEDKTLPSSETETKLTAPNFFKCVIPPMITYYKEVKECNKITDTKEKEKCLLAAIEKYNIAKKNCLKNEGISERLYGNPTNQAIKTYQDCKRTMGAQEAFKCGYDTIEKLKKTKITKPIKEEKPLEVSLGEDIPMIRPSQTSQESKPVTSQSAVEEEETLYKYPKFFEYIIPKRKDFTSKKVRCKNKDDDKAKKKCLNTNSKNWDNARKAALKMIGVDEKHYKKVDEALVAFYKCQGEYQVYTQCSLDDDVCLREKQPVYKCWNSIITDLKRL